MPRTHSGYPTCLALSIFTPDREFVETVARFNLNALGNPLKIYHYDTEAHGVKHAFGVSSLRAAFLAMRASLDSNVCPAHQELFRLVAEIRTVNQKIQRAGFGRGVSNRKASLRAERDALLEEARGQIKAARDACPVRAAARAKDGLTSSAAITS